MDIYTPEKCKKQTKTHKMEVLDKLEREHLESHSRGPGFESLCAHTICRKNSLQNENNLLIWGLYFLCNFKECAGVAKVLQKRRNCFTVEVGSSSFYTPIQNVQSSLQNVPSFSAMLYRSTNGYSSQMPRSSMPNDCASTLLLHNSPNGGLEIH